MSETTQDPRYLRRKLGNRQEPLPGLVLLWAGEAAAAAVVPLDAGLVEVGRELVGRLGLVDHALSRQHARVALQRGAFEVEDLASRNGTWVDGVRLSGARTVGPGTVLRVAETLALLLSDVRPHVERPLTVRDGQVAGPGLKRALEALGPGAGRVIHIQGETGSGKELAARHFHDCGPGAKAPFVAVNCATIPSALAERLLFGARKGAFSGADADAQGYVDAANGGTLFLDEVAELDLSVQAKLLRVLETGEVLPLGAARGKAVSFGLCTATREDLRARVAAGRFRDDLFYRVGRPEVRLPPLRERREEIPHLLQLALRELKAPPATAPLVETCLLRGWPGNVRELLAECRAAGRAALAAGDAAVDVSHLAGDAGRAAREPERSAAGLDDALVRKTLDEAQGNVTEAARRLGLHRNQLRRWVSRQAQVGSPRDTEPDGDDG